MHLVLLQLHRHRCEEFGGLERLGMSGFRNKARINQKQTTQQQMLGPEPSYEVTLDFPLSERQRLALYLVRHLRGLYVALGLVNSRKDTLNHCDLCHTLQIPLTVERVH